MDATNPKPQTEADRRAAVDAALDRADQLRRERRYDEGIEMLVEALAYGIEKGQIYFRLGNLYYDAGDNERAEYAFRKAISNDPNHINAHHNLGVVHRKQGRVRESIQMRKKAQRLARQHPDRITVAPEQAKVARKFALQWLFGGLGIIIGLIVIVMLLAWLF